ncbi:hypothetical protein T02_1364 [Trichinella nativa]|uniref:Uncharacterized protein n=1 Tax=Trichinella nativa TaxID=6335 RepID=A0A0V1L3X9_9BILA|nr:hypothetical protein T02_1364 [Trichinella nativa]
MNESKRPKKWPKKTQNAWCEGEKVEVKQTSKQASKQAGKQAMKPVLEKEDKLLARRARSNQKTEDIRRRSSSCAETFSSSLPANFAKQAR